MNFYGRLNEGLEALRAQECLRTLPKVPSGLVNLSSNDYLGLLEEVELRESFYAQLQGDDRFLSAASSRLLTGNTAAVCALERDLAHLYDAETSLVLGSGYHANTGIIPALAGSKTLILADKLIHASMIDGIRLSGCRYFRYRHNDLTHARQLLERYSAEFDEVIVMTESVFSMDGDRTDLAELVALKTSFPNVVLYLDEAHGVGVFGETGLGCAHALKLHHQIDLLVGTLGKALSSTGAYVICNATVRETLVNRMRPFIFTTALPPINLAWTRFVLSALPAMGERRTRLLAMGQRLVAAFRTKGIECVSDSQIVPYLIGSNEQTIACAEKFRHAGFYVLPIRPPTVPEGSSRLRFSLTAAMSNRDFERLLEIVAS